MQAFLVPSFLGGLFLYYGTLNNVNKRIVRRAQEHPRVRRPPVLGPLCQASDMRSFEVRGYKSFCEVSMRPTSVLWRSAFGVCETSGGKG